MDESLIWGGLGVLLAIGGVAIFVPEFRHAIEEGGLGNPIAIYGVLAAVAMVVTIAVVLPSLVSDR